MRAIILFCCSVVLTCTVCGQHTKPIISPSPNVASLVSYTEIPVGKYTGTPSINLPLYTIQSGGLQLPLSLSYSASGIRPNQEASWVGLGWTLNAGGAISRSIRGRDDFDASTAYWQHSYPTTPLADGEWVRPVDVASTNTEWLHRMLNGELDPEPDMFLFNFCGFSGKFFIDKPLTPTSGPTIRMVDQKDNLKIELLTTEDNFRITDGNGVKYYFGTREYAHTETEEHYWPLDYFPPADHDIPYGGAECEDKKLITAWYLDYMEAPNGDRIDFVYATAPSCTGVLSQTTFSAERFKKTGENTWGFYQPSGEPTGGFSLPGNMVGYTYSKTLSQEVKLDHISFKNGQVSFTETSPRFDVIGFGSYIPEKLDAIAITNSDDKVINNIYFLYSYFGNALNARHGRLKLDAVYTTESPYKFTYETSIPLPSKLTTSLDHWGYYNGAYNNTIIPSSAFDGAPLTPFGANREVDDNYTQIGMLKQIEYPTGGKTQFEYESNDFYNTTGEPIYEDGSIFLEASLNYYPNYNNPFEQIDFYLPPALPGQLPQIAAGFYSSSNQGCQSWQSGEPFALLVKIPGQGQASYSTLEDYIDNYSNYNIVVEDIIDYEGCTEPAWFEEHHSYNLDPGWYRLVLQPTAFYVASSQINYHYITSFNTTSFNRKGGGLRVKKIKTLDEVNNVSVTKYDYKSTDNTTSSGQLMSVPTYDCNTTTSLENFVFIGPDAQTMEEWNFTDYHMIRSESFCPLSNGAQGSYVGYDRVVETFGENGENGKKISTFTNFPSGGFLFTPPNEPLGNGLLETEKTLDAAGNPLVYTENEYSNYLESEHYSLALSSHTMPFFYGLGINPLRFWDPFPDEPASYFLHYYQVLSRWNYLSTSTTTTYSPSGNMATTSTYTYNPTNKQLVKEVKDIGDNKQQVTKYKYPNEYNSSAGTVYSAMVTAHVTDVPVEIQNWQIDNSVEKLTGSTVTEFKQFDKYNSADKFINPYRIYRMNSPSSLTTAQVGQSSNSTGPYSSLLFNTQYFDQENEFDYDLYGKTKRISGRGNQVKSYLWEYNNSLPIAEAINAAQNEIFYTGFEASGTTGAAHTGTKYYNGDYNLNFTIPNGRTYKYSYWYRQGSSWVFSGELNYTGAVLLTNGDAIDDVRVYPQDAQMSTYTYTPLQGMTTSTDANSKTNYYDYDWYSRLRTIRDPDGNILKKFCYNYVNLPEHCDQATFYNVQFSQDFMPDCGADHIYNGTGLVTYTVPASTYSSTISPAAANQLALNDINLNGQTYANNYAVNNNLCIPIYWNVQKSATFTRNNCGNGGLGSAVIYVVPAHSYSSLLSQADADNLAQIQVNTNGQGYANSIGACRYIYARLESTLNYFYEDEYTYWEDWDFYFRFYSDASANAPIQLPSDLEIHYTMESTWGGVGHYTLTAPMGSTEYFLGTITTWYSDPYWYNGVNVLLDPGPHYLDLSPITY
jgi:YD repeat-containing protein